MKKYLFFLAVLVFALSCNKDKKLQGSSEKSVKKQVSAEKKGKESKKEPVKKQEEKKKEVKKKKNEGGKINYEDRKKIVEFAKSFEGKKIPESSNWNKYSSGFVKMVYLKFGVDITDIDKKKDGEGKWLTTTQMIYEYFKNNGDLFFGKMPEIGDLVFFDNTYDANKDGVFNDKLTGVGIVTEIDKDGTIFFLYNTSKGVSLKMINMKYPEKKNIKSKNITKTVNSQLRWLTQKEKSDPIAYKYPTLSAQLLNNFASILNKHTLKELAFVKNLDKDKREDIVKFAKKFENKDIPQSDRWNKYASGFVKMVFLSQKLDLTNTENKKDEEGKWFSTTKIIFNFVKENGKIFKDKRPGKGDIVFFDNTFDKNKDGEFNDELTSMGLVVDIDDDGTVYFLYKSGKGVKEGVLNLKTPDVKEIKSKNITKRINSQMRWIGEKDKKNKDIEKYKLAGQLFNSFGSVFK